MFTTKFDSSPNPTNSNSETYDKNKIAKNSSIDSNKDKEEVNTLYREEKEVIPIYNKEPI